MDKIVKKSFSGFERTNEKLFLEGMAMDGFLLKKIKGRKYFFESIAPQKIIYEHDFLSLKKPEEKEYLSYISDWKYAAKTGPYYWFYIESNGDKIVNPFFNNNETLRDFYKRKLLFVLVMFLILLLFTINGFVLSSDNVYVSSKYFKIFEYLNIIVMVIYLKSVIKFLRLYLKANSKINE